MLGDIVWWKMGLLLLVGLVAGFINAVAGGGSLLTLPVFIFLGFEQNVANATNRVAVFFQSLASAQGFRSKGVSAFGYSMILGLWASAGAVIGTLLAVNFTGEAFDTVLAIVMLAVSVIIIFNPFKGKKEVAERMAKKYKLIAGITFFFIGIYGGFLQAGTGFLVIAALTLINRFSLVKSNAIKVLVNFVFTIVALSIFALKGLIRWEYGLVLATSQSAGGWLGSRWSVAKGDVWIKRVMLVMIILMALKLLGVFEWMGLPV